MYKIHEFITVSNLCSIQFYSVENINWVWIKLRNVSEKKTVIAFIFHSSFDINKL